jgi:GAF domain-containing protein
LQLGLEGLAAKLAGAVRADHVGRVLVEGVGETCGSVCSVLYLLDGRGNRLRMARASGLPLSATRPLGRLSLDARFPLARAVRAGRALWFRDRAALLAHYPDFYVQLPHPQIQSLAALPLKVGDQVVGGFLTGYSEAQPFGDDDLEFLIVTVDLAARALQRCTGEGAEDEVPRPCVSFRPLTEADRLVRARAREHLDIGRIVRGIARIQLSALRNEGRTLLCEANGSLTGRRDRSWTERLVRGLLALAIDLVPGVDLSVDARREGEDAVIDVRYTAGRAEGSFSQASGRADLARMTTEHEQWSLRFWLWRSLARQDGAKLELLPGRNGVDGLSLTLPLGAF